MEIVVFGLKLVMTDFVEQVYINKTAPEPQLNVGWAAHTGLIEGVSTVVIGPEHYIYRVGNEPDVNTLAARPLDKVGAQLLQWAVEAPLEHDGVDTYTLTTE